MYQNVTNNQHTSAMEAGNHSKNGASLKSHTSRGIYKGKMSKTKHFTKIVLLMTAVFFFSSCASIVTKSRYSLPINSTPRDATISITDKKGREVYAGNTPTVVRLRAGAGYFAKAEYQVTFSSPGYDSQVVPVTFSIDGWYFGNILFGGLIGMLIVDPATGAMWKMDAEFIDVTLNSSTRSSTTPEMNILNINEIPQEWKTHLVRLN